MSTGQGLDFKPTHYPLDHMLTHGKPTVGDLERTFPEINRRTLQPDLKAMLDKGVLREVGTGPTNPNRRYVLGDL